MNIDTLPLLLDENNDLTQNTLSEIIENLRFLFIFCLTLPLYILLIILLLEAQCQRVKQLNTPFYKLYISTSIIDFFTILNNYFGVIIPGWGWFPGIYLNLGTFYSQTYLYFAWCTGVCGAISTSVLTANRLSAILHSNRYQLIWFRRRLNLAICIQFVPGITIGMVTFFNPSALFRNRNNGIVAKFQNKTLTKYFFLTGGIVLSSNCAYLIVAYIYIFYVLQKRNRQNVRCINSKNKKMLKRNEFRLFLMSSIIVAVQLTCLLIVINKYTNVIILTSDQFHMLYNLVSDLYTAINPYLLWIFSDSLRKYIFKRIRWKKHNITTIFNASMVTNA